METRTSACEIVFDSIPDSFEPPFVVQLLGLIDRSQKIVEKIARGPPDQVGASSGRKRADKLRMRLPIRRLPGADVHIKVREARLFPGNQNESVARVDDV